MILDKRENPKIIELLKDLFNFNIGPVYQDNVSFFQRINQELPLKLHKYKSGLSFNGWIVPPLWKVKKAIIIKDNNIVFDGKIHPLAVASYSKSFKGEIDFEELKKHIVTKPELPDAYSYHCIWQYRLWSADWAFTAPYKIFQNFTQGKYKIDLETTYEDGKMIVAEYEHKGKSEKTIIFNAHTCHAMQANDDLAGVALLIRLFQWLKNYETYYTYKLILAPEHLGTVFYLNDKSEKELEKFVSGAFAEMPGTKDPIKIASSFLGNQIIDKAFRNAARHNNSSCQLVSWREGAGNDETVWEAPGYEVPFVEISRSKNFSSPYPEYHTSLDNVELMDEEKLNEFYRVFQNVVFILEHNAIIRRKFDGLVCLSNPEYNLYFERPDPSIVKDINKETEKWGHLIDSLLRYFDGSITILDIAEKHDLLFNELYKYLLRFKEKGLIELEFTPIKRLEISKIIK